MNGWKGSSPPGRSVGVSVVLCVLLFFLLSCVISFLVELCCAVFFFLGGGQGERDSGNWESEGLLWLERYKEGQDIVLFVKKR